MCCFFLIFMVLGPRAAVIFWWILEPGRWDRAFDTFIIPVLGFVFLPFTTLMWVAVAPFGNVEDWDWVWLALAVAGDIALWSGSYARRRDAPYYPTTYA